MILFNLIGLKPKLVQFILASLLYCPFTTRKSCCSKEPPKWLSFHDIYRPQHSCGKVMFLHLFVILFTGDVWQTPPQADTPPGQLTPWADRCPSEADTPSKEDTPGQTPSLDRHPIPLDRPHRQTPPGQTPSWTDTPLGRHPLWVDTPWQIPPPTRRWPLQRMLRILLECILVLKCLGTFHIYTNIMNVKADRILESPWWTAVYKAEGKYWNMDTWKFQKITSLEFLVRMA